MLEEQRQDSVRAIIRLHPKLVNGNFLPPSANPAIIKQEQIQSGVASSPRFPVAGPLEQQGFSPAGTVIKFEGQLKSGA